MLMRKRISEKVTKENSRRDFLKTAGLLSVGIAGTSVLTNCVSPASDSSENKSSGKGDLFKGKPVSNEDRIERVKIATLGMQRIDWEQGTVAQAFLEMGEFDIVVSLARAAILRQTNGRFSVLMGNGPITDCSSAGEAVLFAGKYTGNPVFKKGADEMLGVFKSSGHKTADGILYHTQEPAKMIMSDANYMLPPFLAAAGEYDEAIKQIDGWRKYLYNPQEKLYSHIWDAENNKFRREDFWGVGNGWSVAGFTRVIKQLSENRLEEKKKLIGYVKDTLDGCLKYLREDGMFHNVVNKPDTFIEVNLSQMLSYSIFRGVAAGYLDSGYLQKAGLMRKAANDRVDELGYVHDVCGLPDFDRPYFAPEGQAFYLLMETAARDLAKSR
jgi:unsaturated rhamnogalacturonyl hydrolase